jgi:hypothetical protein
MFESIEAYLEQLKRELAGCDPATVQDALSDAEEHLRTAFEQTRNSLPDLAEIDILQRIFDVYGTPTDVAAAYREVEIRTTPTLAPRPRSAEAEGIQVGVSQTLPARSFASRFFGVFVDPRAYASLFYMFFSLITGIIYFTWVTTGVSLSLGLMILVIGLPFLIVFLLSVQGIALVEGRIVEALLGVRMPRRPLFSGRHLGLWDRLKILFTDKLSWTTMAYMVIQLPLGILYFTVFLTMLVFGLVGIAYPVLYITLDLPFAQSDGWEFYPPVWFMPLLVAVGALWILVTMHAAKYIGRVHGALAKALLVRD